LGFEGRWIKVATRSNVKNLPISSEWLERSQVIHNKDSLPLADRSLTDSLRCNTASYEWILIKFSVAVRRGPRMNRLDFGGSLNQGPDLGFMDPDPEFFEEIFWRGVAWFKEQLVRFWR